VSEHPDRLRWNARYAGTEPEFVPHPLVAAAISAGLPDGAVLELACGRSGSALALAAEGRQVVAVDVSDLALAQLAAEARRRGLESLVDCVPADVPSYDPEDRQFALVLCTRFWDAQAFDMGCAAVAPGGLLAWEALCSSGDLAEPWRIRHGALRSQLPQGFTALDERVERHGRHRTTQLLARRAQGGRWGGRWGGRGGGRWGVRWGGQWGVRRPLRC